MKPLRTLREFDFVQAGQVGIAHLMLFFAQGKYGINDYTRCHESDNVLDVKQAVYRIVCHMARVCIRERGKQSRCDR